MCDQMANSGVTVFTHDRRELNEHQRQVFQQVLDGNELSR